MPGLGEYYSPRSNKKAGVPDNILGDFFLAAADTRYDSMDGLLSLVFSRLSLAFSRLSTQELAPRSHCYGPTTPIDIAPPMGGGTLASPNPRIAVEYDSIGRGRRDAPDRETRACCIALSCTGQHTANSAHPRR